MLVGLGGPAPLPGLRRRQWGCTLHWLGWQGCRSDTAGAPAAWWALATSVAAPADQEASVALEAAAEDPGEESTMF